MAMTQFGVNSPQTRKIWSDQLFREVPEAMWFRKFMGKSDRSVIQQLTELEKQRGDQIKYDLLMQMSGEGVDGADQMWDAEEALTFYQDSVLINQKRNAHKFDTMSQQRTVHELKKLAKGNLKDWFAHIFDSYMFRSLGGDTTFNFAGNTGVAPDEDHYMMCGNVVKTGTIATDEAGLGANDRIKLEDLNYLKEIAQNSTPRIRPVRVDGDEYYIIVLHDFAATDLKLNLGNSTLGSWQDVAKNADVRGSKNRIWTGNIGIYDGMIVYQSQNIYSPRSNVYRNLLLGAQAGVIAFGNAYKKSDLATVGEGNYFTWFEEVGDYGDKQGVAAGSVFGIKKCRFNATDFAVVTASGYSGVHR